MSKYFERKILIGILSGFFVCFLVWSLQKAGFPGNLFWEIDRFIFEQQQNKPLREASELVVVTIDRTTLKALGKIHDWPDSLWITAINKLKKGNAYLIGFNFILDGMKQSPSEDSLLLQTIRQSGNIINTIAVTPTENFPVISFPIEASRLPVGRFRPHVSEAVLNTLPSYRYIAPRPSSYLNAGIGLGAVSLPAERQGTLWRVPLILRINQKIYPGFAATMIFAFLQADSITWRDSQILITTQSGQPFKFPINYMGGTLASRWITRERFSHVSFYTLLRELNETAELQKVFRNKVVMIGPTHAAMEEMYSSPLPTYPADVTVQANAFLQMINSRTVRELSGVQSFLIFLFTATLAGVLLCYFRLREGLFISIIITSGFILLAGWTLATKSIWLPLTFSLLTWWLTYALCHGTRYWIAARKNRRLEILFSSYLSPAAIKALGQHVQDLKLAGEKKECTIFHSSLRGFDSALQVVTVEKWVALLNQYLSGMSRCILDQNGTIEGYRGEMVRAIFGAPAPLDDHAFQACKTALEIQRAFKILRNEWRTIGIPEISLSVDISTGPVIVGNLGSDFRFAYAAVGDPVDVITRLEEVNRLYNTSLLLSEDTYQLVKERVVIRQLDRLRVRGRRDPLNVYELIALAQEPLDLEIREILTFFQQGYEYYLAKHWEWAANQFRQVLQIDNHDGPARIYLLRCQEFLQNPPGWEWDGVYTLKVR